MGPLLYFAVDAGRVSLGVDGWMNNGEHMNEGMGGRERLWSREVVRQLSITYGEISAEPVGRQESDRIDNYLTGFVTIQPQHLTAG